MAKKKNTETAVETKVSTRAKVLVPKTATEIGERFGYDTQILISRKDWLSKAAKEKLGLVAEEEGL